jgi:hypothetical protein
MRHGRQQRPEAKCHLRRKQEIYFRLSAKMTGIWHHHRNPHSHGIPNSKASDFTPLSTSLTTNSGLPWARDKRPVTTRSANSKFSTKPNTLRSEFQRALRALHVAHLVAPTPQAKGKIERGARSSTKINMAPDSRRFHVETCLALLRQKIQF